MLLRNNEAYFWRTALQIDGNKDSDVLVGDEGYMSLCRRCLRRILIRNNDNRLSK